MENGNLKTNYNLYGLGLEELISLGMEAREAYDNSRWLIGDIASVIYNRFGAQALLEFATKIGISKDSIERYKEVAQKFDDDTRREFQQLSWSHFRAAAGQQDPKQWLERAADDSYSVEKLSVEIKKESTPVEEINIKPRVTRCTCGKWIVIADEKAVCKRKGIH